MCIRDSAHLLLELFLEVEVALVSSSAKQVIVPDIIAAIQSYLDRNYPSGITLDALSKQFGISKYHMSREFKRYIGKSPTTTSSTSGSTTPRCCWWTPRAPSPR